MTAMERQTRRVGNGTELADNGLTAGEQERRREWFREHWAKGVPFNRHCALEVRQWDAEAVELFLPYADELSAHTGIFHGGVVAALLDTTASGAVWPATTSPRAAA